MCAKKKKQPKKKSNLCSRWQTRGRRWHYQSKDSQLKNGHMKSESTWSWSRWQTRGRRWRNRAPSGPSLRRRRQRRGRRWHHRASSLRSLRSRWQTRGRRWHHRASSPSGPCKSPERPPRHLKRSAPSAPSEPPPAHVLARAARTRESSTTAQLNNDWTCPTCGNVNWFRRGYCIGGRGQCLRPREATWLPGDWFCSCGNHNLARRTVCNRSKCNLPRAQGEMPRF